MIVLIATDAWHPQINGVVRTLGSLAAQLRKFGVTVEFLTPDGFPSFELPGYPGLRCAIPRQREIVRRIDQIAPDAIHIATEGPVGLATRRFCLSRNFAFTTSFTTRFAEYASARFPVPLSWGYGILRWFHEPAATTMVSTQSLQDDLESRGFGHLSRWTRGVDTDLFNPDTPAPLDLPRPIFLNVGRVAVEKNLEAFLSLDLPGSKVVIGQGPHEERLRTLYPEAHFLGAINDESLAAHYASADVFVFPSLTDTFGVVLLEALACGVPVAAFPVTGPRDVVGTTPVGVISDDLKSACLQALKISRQACRDHALRQGWDASARQFLNNLVPVSIKISHARLDSSATGGLRPG